MSHRMSTYSRLDRQRDNAAISRTVNGHLKRKERARRDKQMVELLKKGKFPYTPAVMNWVSLQLGKPSSQVSEAEAKALAK
jgi:hypothetical protein